MWMRWKMVAVFAVGLAAVAGLWRWFMGTETFETYFGGLQYQRQVNGTRVPEQTSVELSATRTASAAEDALKARIGTRAYWAFDEDAVLSDSRRI